MSNQVYDVAIVLVNYNNKADTKECIQSISASTELPFIVVVDNASNNADTIEKELSFYPHLKCFISDTNLGFGRANNLAIEWVFANLNTAYIFILNNDTIVEKNSIEKLKRSLKNTDDSIAMAAPLIRQYPDKEKIWYAGGSMNFFKWVPKVYHTLSDDKSFLTGFASGCAMFFKTESLKKIGGFDPFYFMYDEDVELSIRLTFLKYKIIFVPSAVVYHKCQGSQTNEPGIPPNQLHPDHPALLFYLNNTIVNRKHTIAKYYRGNQKARACFNQFVYWSAKALQYAISGKGTAAFAVVKNLVKNRTDKIIPH